MGDIITKILEVILLLTFGKLMSYKNYIVSSTINDIRKLMIDILLPCILFVSFATMEIEKEHFSLTILIIIMQILFLFSAILLNRISWIHNILIPYLCCGCTFGFLGIPLFLMVYGLGDLGNYTILGIGHEFFVWIIFFPWLRLNMLKSKFNLKEVMKILKTPAIISIVIGVIVGYYDLHVVLNRNIIYQGIFNTLESLSLLTVSLIIIIVGYGITLDYRFIKTSIKIVFIRMAIILLIGYAFKYFIINLFISANPIFDHAFFTFLILPAPMIIPMFMTVYGSEESGNIASNVIAINTLLSIFIYMIVLILFS